MKKRKFEEGGSVYERAKKFLREQGVSDDTPALDEKIAAARMRRGETSRSEIPGDGDAVPMRREVTVEPEPSRASPTPTPRSVPAPARAKPPTDTGDETERLARRAPEPDRGAALRDTERKDAATRAAQSAAADARNVAEIENARGKLVSNTNRMGVRAAQQMEDKGSIYSPDFGKPRAVREAEGKARRMPLPRSQRMFQGRRQMDRPTSPGGYAKGGSVSSASNRADGIAKRGKTRGRML